LKPLTIRRIACLIVWLACQAPGSVSANQDPLSTVRELYLSADYEGALGVIDRLDRDTQNTRTDIADYRVFCLLALERTDEARQAIKSIVETDPLHQLTEGQASPRMRAVFQETRKALLPDLVHRMYAQAKTAFDNHDPAAVRQFDRLITLLDDPDLKDAQLSDLRGVAAGFRDLSKAANVDAVAPAPVRRADAVQPKPDATPDGTAGKPDTTKDVVDKKPDTTSAAPKPAGPLTGPPDKIRVSSRGSSPLFTAKEPPPPGLEPPLAISQTIPPWPRRGGAAQQTLNGVIEVAIDEQGNVTTVALQQPTLPAFDKALLKAARTWKYKPGLLNGTPVSFVKVIEIQIQPDR
jgi:TonB family protein